MLKDADLAPEPGAFPSDEGTGCKTATLIPHDWSYEVSLGHLMP